MIFKTALGRGWVPVGHWYKSLTDFLNLFDFKHLDFWTSGQFHMSKGMLHFNPIVLFLFYLFWSDCHFHNYSNSLFWILILHKLLVTCFLAVGSFPQATETTVLCLASPTSISGYTASNPNYFYISLIHLMKKRNFSFPIPPRIVQRLFDMQDVQLQQFSIRMILKWEVGKNHFYFPIFLARAVQAAAAYFYPMANMKCQSFGCKNRRRGKTSRRVENMMLASKLWICNLDTKVNTVFVHLKLFNNTVFFFLFLFCIMLIKWEFLESFKSNPHSLPLA